MARDYARNRTSRRNARIAETTPRGGKRPSGQRRLNAYRQPRAPRTFSGLIVGIFLGLLIAGGLYIKYCRSNQVPATLEKSTEEMTSTTKPSHNKKHHKTAAISSADDDPEIAELAENEGDNEPADHSKPVVKKTHKKNPDESAQQHYDFYTMLPKNDVETSEGSTREEPNSNDSSTKRYQLQLASFTKYEDADHLKAQLILQGYNASIQKHQREGVKRYRVTIGPFNNTKAATAEQQRLSKNNIKSLLVPL